MAIVAHGHHIHVMTRFRAQVLSRAAVLLLAGLVSWQLPHRNPSVLDSSGSWLGSAVIDVQPAAALALLVAVGVAGFVWQRSRPADMGALAWVVAGGVLAAAASVLVVLDGMTEGPVYWWLGLGVMITSMALQVVAALIGHGLAVLAARRS